MVVGPGGVEGVGLVVGVVEPVGHVISPLLGQVATGRSYDPSVVLVKPSVAPDAAPELAVAGHGALPRRLQAHL